MVWVDSSPGSRASYQRVWHQFGEYCGEYCTVVGQALERQVLHGAERQSAFGLPLFPRLSLMVLDDLENTRCIRIIPTPAYTYLPSFGSQHTRFRGTPRCL